MQNTSADARAVATYRPQPFVHRYPPQRVIYGEGATGQLQSVLEELGLRRALLACGANTSANRTLIDPLLSGAGGRIAATWNGVRPHAPAATIDAAVAAYREAGCDGFVSLGGGSTHDTMRAASFVVQSGGALMDHFADPSKAYAQYVAKEGAQRVAMIAIPTTFSAAETTFGAGVTAGARKYVLFGEALYIDRIVLDPAVFATTPPQVLIETGLNAVNHALERLLSPKHQPIGDAAFIHALRLLLPGLVALKRNARDADALTNAILGAHLSESTNVLGGIGHAVAHVLGGKYHIPHGVAHGLGAIPGVLFAGPGNPAALAMLAQIFTEAGLMDRGGDELAGVSDAMRAYLGRLGLPTRLRDVAIAEADIPAIAADIMVDFSAASSVAAGLRQAEVERLLAQIW